MTVEVSIVSAAWCSNCKPYKQAVKSAGVQFEEIDADVDENMELISSLGVRSLPTTLIYKNGELVKMFSGNKIEELKQSIKEFE